MFPLSLNEPINKKDKDNFEALVHLEKHENKEPAVSTGTAEYIYKVKRHKKWDTKLSNLEYRHSDLNYIQLNTQIEM